MIELDIENEMVVAHCVDLGIEKKVTVDSIRALADDFITHLPHAVGIHYYLGQRWG